MGALLVHHLLAQQLLQVQGDQREDLPYKDRRQEIATASLKDTKIKQSRIVRDEALIVAQVPMAHSLVSNKISTGVPLLRSPFRPYMERE